MKCTDKVSKYDTIKDYTTFCIDTLPLRHSVKKEKVLLSNMHQCNYTKGVHTCKRLKHIHGLDRYDKSRNLSAINKIKLGNKYTPTYYVIIDNTKVLLNKYIKRLKHYKVPFIIDNEVNHKIYVNGAIYDIKYTTIK